MLYRRRGFRIYLPLKGKIKVSCVLLSYDYESALMGEFIQNVQKKRAKEMDFSFKCIIASGFYTQINFMVLPAFEKYTRDDVDFMLLFPCWFPFDLSYFPYHAMVYLWELIVLAQIGLTIYGVMSSLYIPYKHITTEFTVLNFAIEKMDERAEEIALRSNIRGGRENGRFLTKNDQENIMKEAYIEALNMCVEHHLQIIDYFNVAYDLFKLIYMLVYATGLVVCTSTGFALISDNTALKIKFLGITMIQLVYLYIVCWFGEKIAEISEEIRLTIFGIKWYAMPKETWTTFRVMIIRTLKPLRFTTLTGQQVDLDNYMSMIKASYSYFNMMLASQEKT